MKRFASARPWAIGLGVLAACLSWACNPGVLDGRVWQLLAEAAGLRPPEYLLPGLWRLLAHACVRLFGLDGTAKLLLVAGPVALGYVTYRAMSSIHVVLSLILRTDRCPPIFQKVFIPGLIASGVAYFVSAWPVFPASRTLTPLLLTLVVLFTIFGLARRFLMTSNRFCGALAIFLTGVAAADGLFGWIVLLGVVVCCWARRRYDESGTFILSNIALRNLLKWVATFLFLIGFLGVLLANCHFFVGHGGAWSTAFLNYRMVLKGGDAAVALGLVVAPCLLTLVLLPRATDTESFLPYARGMCLLACGVVVSVFLLQPGLLAFPSEALTVLLRYLATFTLVGVLTAVVVEVYCRNYVSVFIFRYQGDLPATADRGEYRFPKFVRRYLYAVLVGTLVLLSAWTLGRDGSARLAREVDACADLILDEAAGLERIFSDGSIDELLEVKAARRGERILCTPLIAKRDAHAVAVRQRGVVGENDRLEMALGASVALRSWLDVKAPALAKSALQLGFEFWRRRADAHLPALGGFLARPGGYPETAAGSDAAIPARLAAEAFAVRADSPELVRACRRCYDRPLGQRFDALKWRVARILELRARQEDQQGRLDEGARLSALARRLDDRNASLSEMRSFLGLLWEQADLKMTPRDGLSIALKHANFRAAQSHARAVLASHPGDPDANFALGMYHYLEGNLKRADDYLGMALRACPEEPAFLNNLAIVRMRQGKLSEALELSDRALALRPDRDDLRLTNEEIRRRSAAK